MLTTFNVYQDRIRTITAEAEMLLRDRGRASIARISALRVDQGVAMAAYQLFMHREVFTPMISAASPASAVAARELKIECITLSNDFSIYARTWAKIDPLAEWDSYFPAAMQMIGRIRSHLDKVEAPARALLAARLSEDRAVA